MSEQEPTDISVTSGSTPEGGDGQQRTVDPLTVLMNSVEVAQKRGAFSLDEAGIISQAVQFYRQKLKEQQEAQGGAPAATPASSTSSLAESTTL
tara:strand:- start:337 stop:618 length:282 start_codon:yes stop_codon:yes gene_type:complete